MVRSDHMNYLHRSQYSKEASPPISHDIWTAEVKHNNIQYVLHDSNIPFGSNISKLQYDLDLECHDLICPHGSIMLMYIIKTNNITNYHHYL